MDLSSHVIWLPVIIIFTILKFILNNICVDFDFFYNLYLLFLF